jgi:hypothetical protein
MLLGIRPSIMEEMAVDKDMKAPAPEWIVAMLAKGE